MKKRSEYLVSPVSYERMHTDIEPATNEPQANCEPVEVPPVGFATADSGMR